jgi:hypothetical protein
VTDPLEAALGATDFAATADLFPAFGVAELPDGP